MSLIIAAETSFNPRTRVGCDVGAGVGCRTATLFQSTHPRGVRPCPGPMWTGQRPCFNPRTRVGCDFGSNRMISSELQFQSTHPRGVRPAAFADRASRRSCFNPRTRVGCDVNHRVTREQHREFQSTHPRGVRLCTALDLPHMVRFQSTHPRGVRRASATFLAATARVSIHAPAWGATWYTSQTSSPLLSFNPRTRVGCDINADIDRWNYDQFQSTHPRGVRPGRS